MARKTYIQFRDEEDVPIEFTGGRYDPETGDDGLEWWFEDTHMSDVEPTDAEEEAILKRIYEILDDWD